jgi:hypothetical protein
MMSRRTYLNGREVRGMTDETEECRHRVALLKESAESANNGRKLERGDRGAYPKTILRLCEVLGVAPEDLLSGGGTE